MSNLLKDRVIARLEEIGKGPVEAATAVGLERNYIRDIVLGKKTSVRLSMLDRLAVALETTVEYLTDQRASKELDGALRDQDANLPEPNVDLAQAEDLRRPPSFGGPRNVPVLGTAVGGGDEDGDFTFNGETIDYAPRPPGIAHRKDVYAVYLQNTSMWPRYNDGARIYVDPHRKPSVGDDALIELYPTEDGENGKGFIKSVVKRTSTQLIVEQFNPRKEITFDLRKVKTFHRVIPYDELLGI